MIKITKTLIVLSLFINIGCSNAQNASKEENKNTEATTNTPVAEDINAEKFKEMMSDENVVILDVRTPEEVAGGIIPGAKNINLHGNFSEDIKSLDKSKTYLVYCARGGRSSKAMNIMSNQGFNTVYNLLGGYMGWTANGNEVSK